MEVDKSFYLNVTGTIDYAHLPFGIAGKALRCRYEIVYGSDWELINGSHSGISQASSPGSKFQQVTFDMPIEFTMKSTNPFGWPQIVFNLYGDNIWGSEVSCGSTRIHVPLKGRRTMEANLVSPQPVDFCTKLFAWLSSCPTEFRDVTVLTQGHRLKGVRTESYGSLFVTLQTISRGKNALNFEW